MAEGALHLIFELDIAGGTSAAGVNGPVTLDAGGPVSVSTLGAVSVAVASTPTLELPVPVTLTAGDGDPTIEVDC